MRAQVELTLRLGQYGERVETVVVPLSEGIARDLMEPMEPMELSDEPWSLMLASPGLMGCKGDAVTIRKRTFKMREGYSKEIAAALTDKLVELFGSEDRVNGYRQNEWSERDKRQAAYIRKTKGNP